jgi:hypothetical protein
VFTRTISRVAQSVYAFAVIKQQAVYFGVILKATKQIVLIGINFSPFSLPRYIPHSNEKGAVSTERYETATGAKFCKSVG